MRNPWKDLPSTPPYVLPCDSALVAAFKRTANARTMIHEDLLPEPFLGVPDAPVVLLSLNPGYSDDDLVCHRDPTFRYASFANLKHGEQKYPFYLLSTDLDAPGRRWWERILSKILLRLPREVVARRVLCVEFFGYHSRSFAHHRLRLPSQEYAFHLVRKAMERNAIVVIMRSRKLWFERMPELAPYRHQYTLSNPQNPSISPGNCSGRFEEIINAIANG